MLKIESIKKPEGMQIHLPEKWHELGSKCIDIAEEKFPYDFTVKEKVDGAYLCEGIRNKKTFILLVSPLILKYLNGTEMPDSNMGLSLKEYLPVEGTAILLTGKNPSNVIPALMKIDTTREVKNGKLMIGLNFIADWMNGVGKTNLEYYLNRATWKFLFNNDLSYMTDYEKMFQDTFVHKTFVKKSCEKMADYLRTQKMFHHADLLMQRAEVHDNSKISCEDEMTALATIINDKGSLQDASKALSQIKEDAIHLHWKHNSHHPEHYANYADMEKIDILEMCCDWHARSTQYHTDLLEFVDKRQEDRFHFPKYMYEEIRHYCEILIRD